MAELDQQKVPEDLSNQIARDLKKSQKQNPQFQGLKISGKIKARPGGEPETPAHALRGKSPNLGKSLNRPIKTSGDNQTNMTMGENGEEKVDSEAEEKDRDSKAEKGNEENKNEGTASSNEESAQEEEEGGGAPIEERENLNTKAGREKQGARYREKRGETGEGKPTEGEPDQNIPQNQGEQNLGAKQNQALASKAKGKEAQPETDEIDENNELNVKNQFALIRRIAAQNKKNKGQLAAETVTDTVKEAVTTAMQLLTAEALKQSWSNLLETYGLTALYIQFHFIMKYIVGARSFCEFGDEWTLKEKMQQKAMSPGGAGEEEAGGMPQIVNTSLKWAEIILVFSVDIIILTLIVALLMAMYFVASGLFDTVAAVLPT